MSNQITIGQALKRIFSFMFKSEEEPEQSKLETSDEFVHCPKCNSEMAIIHQLPADFLSVLIYKCPKCGTLQEFQYNNANGKLMKEITIYDRYTHTSSAYMEVIDELNYNEFALDRLWEVCGSLCYPMLVKTEFSDNVDLVFIRVEDDLSRNTVDAFLVTDTNMIGKVQVRKSSDFSYFLNPYLHKLPHSTFVYASTPIEKNPNISYVSPIRYRHKISEGSESNSIHELYIVEDFPIQSYGLELFVKFYTTREDDIPIKELLSHVDAKSIIYGSEINTHDGFYIQNSRLSKINMYSLTANISLDERKHFYDSIIKFFDLVG